MNITRIGVYGVAVREGKILLIQQIGGPFKGRYDFPGGGIEFGETPEETLRREFMEEVVMEFDTMTYAVNLTAVTKAPKTDEKEAYIFYQIGMIYKVFGLHAQNGVGDLKHFWVEPKVLNQNNCSALLWKYINYFI